MQLLTTTALKKKISKTLVNVIVRERTGSLQLQNMSNVFKVFFFILSSRRSTRSYLFLGKKREGSSITNDDQDRMEGKKEGK